MHHLVPPPGPLFEYLLAAFAFCAAIRILLAAMRFSEGASRRKEERPKFIHLLCGFGGGPATDDYLQPFVVGLLELIVYPVLMANYDPEFIGAWLGFKVVPKFQKWGEERRHYQRFLIGNALVIIASYKMRVWFY